MRKGLLLSFLICSIIITSCLPSDDESGTDSASASPAVSSTSEDTGFVSYSPEDLQLMEIRYPFFRMEATQYVEEYTTGFFCVPTPDIEHIYYADLETDQQFVFCGDPTCRHQRDEDCVGYFGTIIPGSLQVYDNNLYCWGTPEDFSDFFKIGIDGLERTNLGKPVYEKGQIRGSSEYGIVNNIMYTLSNLGINKDGHVVYAVFQTDLTKSEDSIEIYRTDENDGWNEQTIDGLYVGESDLWFSVHKYRQNAATGKLELMSEVYRYSYEQDDLELCLEYDGFIVFFVLDGDICYSVFDWDNREYLPRVYRVKDTGTEILIEGDGGIVSYDGSYIFIHSLQKEGIRIYGKDGRFIKEHAAESLPEGYTVFTTQNLVMYLKQNAMSYPMTDVFEVWYKTDIVNGTGRGHQFEFNMFPYKEN